MLRPRTYTMSAYIVAESVPMLQDPQILEEKVFSQLIEHLHCDGLNITTEKYFTSFTLAREVLNTKKIGLAATIRTNVLELPHNFVTPNER